MIMIKFNNIRIWLINIIYLKSRRIVEIESKRQIKKVEQKSLRDDVRSYHLSFIDNDTCQISVDLRQINDRLFSQTSDGPNDLFFSKVNKIYERI